MKELTEDRLIQMHTEADERLFLANLFERPISYSYDADRIWRRHRAIEARESERLARDEQREREVA